MPLVPRLRRYYAALRLPEFLRPALCSRSRLAYLVGGRFFFLAAHASTCAQSSESNDRRSASPEIVEESQGLPGCWVVLLPRAVVIYPAGCAVVSPLSSTALLPSGLPTPWASGIRQFRG